MIPVAAGYGAALWLLIALIGQRNEAWDSPLYWLIGLPFLILGAALMGWISASQRRPAAAWQIALAMAVGQTVMMLIMAGAGNMLPLGLILMLVLALPLWAGAGIGGVIARWRRGG